MFQTSFLVLWLLSLMSKSKVDTSFWVRFGLIRSFFDRQMSSMEKDEKMLKIGLNVEKMFITFFQRNQRLQSQCCSDQFRSKSTHFSLSNVVIVGSEEEEGRTLGHQWQVVWFEQWIEKEASSHASLPASSFLLENPRKARWFTTKASGRRREMNNRQMSLDICPDVEVDRREIKSVTYMNMVREQKWSWFIHIGISLMELCWTWWTSLEGICKWSPSFVSLSKTMGRPFLHEFF